ncbi:MAG: class I SAM-dependent methyltransferase [Waddliaceae bacterium]
MNQKGQMRLLFIRFKTDLWNLIEGIRVLFLFWKDLTFFRIDIMLLMKYIRKSPYRISKEHLHEYTYGETPLTTMAKIATECMVTANDRFFDLGCGRGRACFWMHHFIKCKVVGIDYIPKFIAYANQVKEKYHLEGIDFIEESIENSDLSQATIVYFFNLFASASLENTLIEKLPKNAKVITVSSPLSDLFEIEKSFTLQFPWGNAVGYLQSFRKK